MGGYIPPNCTKHFIEGNRNGCYSNGLRYERPWAWTVLKLETGFFAKLHKKNYEWI